MDLCVIKEDVLASAPESPAASPACKIQDWPVPGCPEVCLVPSYHPVRVNPVNGAQERPRPLLKAASQRGPTWQRGGIQAPVSGGFVRSIGLIPSGFYASRPMLKAASGTGIRRHVRPAVSMLGYSVTRVLPGCLHEPVRPSHASYSGLLQIEYPAVHGGFTAS